MPRWVTHQQEDNNNGRILPKEWEAQPPHPAPQPGDSAMERWVPRTFGVNGQWGLLWASLVAQLVKKKQTNTQKKNLPPMQETPVWFLGQEDPLEKG